MIGFDLKKCPMCGGALATRMPPAGTFDRTKRYICSTHLPGTKVSHYHVSSGFGGLIQVIQAPPFFIHNKFGSDRSEVFGFKNGKLLRILNIPRISLENKTSQELSEKVKLFILFS